MNLLILQKEMLLGERGEIDTCQMWLMSSPHDRSSVTVVKQISFNVLIYGIWMHTRGTCTTCNEMLVYGTALIPRL